MPVSRSCAFVHHQNAVGALNGREPVRNDERGAALQPSVLQCVANAQFGFRIDTGSGFVEDQNSRIVGQCPGKVDELFLAG